jgi:hypothetical protein
LEGVLYQDYVNVLEMNLVGLALISLDFISLQDVKDVFIFHKDHVFFVDVVGILVVNEIFGSLEILGFEYAVIFEVFSSKRRRKKNNHAHEFEDGDPTFRFLVEKHPAVEQVLNMITLNDSRVLFFSILQTFNDSSYGQVHN